MRHILKRVKYHKLDKDLSTVSIIRRTKGGITMLSASLYAQHTARSVWNGLWNGIRHIADRYRTAGEHAIYCFVS